MVAMKTRFDGKRILVPDALRGAPPGEVIVIFPEPGADESRAWLKLQEPAFASVWDNDEDAAYDDL